MYGIQQKERDIFTRAATVVAFSGTLKTQFSL